MAERFSKSSDHIKIIILLTQTVEFGREVEQIH